LLGLKTGTSGIGFGDLRALLSLGFQMDTDFPAPGAPGLSRPATSRLGTAWAAFLAF